MKKFISQMRSFIYLLPDILLTFFSKPETTKYPKVSAQISSGFRGSVKIREENCIGCSLCVLDCPSSALELNKKSKDDFQLIHYRDKCTYCGQCQQSCNFNAIYLDNKYINPSRDRTQFRCVLVDRSGSKEN